MQKILISACLLGEKTRYDGRANTLDHPLIHKWRQQGRLILVCPESEGGLPTPRPVAEIVGHGAAQVLSGEARVINLLQRDVSDFFLQGAQIALQRAEEYKIKAALFKEKSPSCGVRFIYNGCLNGTLVRGRGVTTVLLAQNNIQVFSDQEIPKLAAFIDRLEAK